MVHQFDNIELEKHYIFFEYLRKKFPVDGNERIDVSDLVDLESLNLDIKGKLNISLEDEDTFFDPNEYGDGKGRDEEEVDLEDRYDTSITMPDMGLGTLPAGTPVSNGKAGGTYSYAFSNPNYPETWTQKVTSVFTGESRNSSTPFRYATKYIKFMILKNYNQRTGPNDCVWGISNIFLGRVLDNKTYENII